MVSIGQRLDDPPTPRRTVWPLGKRPFLIPSRVGPGQFTNPAEPMVLAHGFQVRGFGQFLELAQDPRVVLGQIAGDALVVEQFAEVSNRKD
jgi:hypothetical protein